MKNFKLIVIEGVDSSGKATQSKLLYEKLITEYNNIETVEFPNYNSDTSAVVKMYLSGEFGKNAGDVSPYAASSFFAVDRAASVYGEWKHIFADDKIVVADRYTTSNMIHQASKIDNNEDKSEFLDWLYDFEYNKLELPQPDIVIFLDMPVKYAKILMENRPNKIDNSKTLDIHESDDTYLNKSYDNAVFVAKKYNWCNISCVKNGEIRSIEDISCEIYSKVKEIL